MLCKISKLLQKFSKHGFTIINWVVENICSYTQFDQPHWKNQNITQNIYSILQYYIQYYLFHLVIAILNLYEYKTLHWPYTPLRGCLNHKKTFF